MENQIKMQELKMQDLGALVRTGQANKSSKNLYKHLQNTLKNNRQYRGELEILYILGEGGEPKYALLGKDEHNSILMLSSNLFGSGIYAFKQNELESMIQNRAERDYGRSWFGFVPNYQILKVTI